MMLDEYNGLCEMVEEFRQEAAGLDEKINSNEKRMAELEAHLKIYTESEPEDFKVFSPRRMETVYSEEIEKIRSEKSSREEENQELYQKKSVLDKRIHLISNIINRPMNNINSADTEKLELLTDREREILVQIAEGKLNKEIAMSLDISERTVKNHISSIFRKIDVLDRTQAAVFAIRNHIVEPGE